MEADRHEGARSRSSGGHRAATAATHAAHQGRAVDIRERASASAGEGKPVDRLVGELAELGLELWQVESRKVPTAFVCGVSQYFLHLLRVGVDELRRLLRDIWMRSKIIHDLLNRLCCHDALLRRLRPRAALARSRTGSLSAAHCNQQ